MHPFPTTQLDSFDQSGPHGQVEFNQRDIQSQQISLDKDNHQSVVVQRNLC